MALAAAGVSAWVAGMHRLASQAVATAAVRQRVNSLLDRRSKAGFLLQRVANGRTGERSNAWVAVKKMPGSLLQQQRPAHGGFV